MSKYQARTEVVLNGKDAVDAVLKNDKGLQEDLFDVILMDCNMPIMDGFEASKIIKEKCRTGEIRSHPFIVAATAYSLDSFRVKARESGMDKFLVKPITIFNLEEILIERKLI